MHVTAIQIFSPINVYVCILSLLISSLSTPLRFISIIKFHLLLCAVYVNDEKLAGLKFGESANQSVWQKKVWQIHAELQVCVDIRLICAIGK